MENTTVETTRAVPVTELVPEFSTVSITVFDGVFYPIIIDVPGEKHLGIDRTMETDLTGVSVQLGYDYLLHTEHPETAGLYFVNGEVMFTTLEPGSVIASYSTNGCH